MRNPRPWAWASVLILLPIFGFWPALEGDFTALFTDAEHYRFAARDQAWLAIHACLWIYLGWLFSNVVWRRPEPSEARPRVGAVTGAESRSASESRSESEAEAEAEAEWIEGAELFLRGAGQSHGMRRGHELRRAVQWVLGQLMRSAFVLLMALPVSLSLFEPTVGRPVDAPDLGPWMAPLVVVSAIVPALWLALRGSATGAYGASAPRGHIPFTLFWIPFFDLLQSSIDLTPVGFIQVLPAMALSLGSPILYYAGPGLMDATLGRRLFRALWLIVFLLALKRGQANPKGRHAAEVSG